MTDEISLNQSALLFSNTGFFSELRTGLMTRSAIEGHSSVKRDKWCKFFTFWKFRKVLF